MLQIDELHCDVFICVHNVRWLHTSSSITLSPSYISFKNSFPPFVKEKRKIKKSPKHTL